MTPASASPSPLLTVPAARGASAAALTGFVLDERQIPVSGAEVSVTGSSRAVTNTDAAGRFTFAGLAPGLYALSVSRAGFQSVTRDDVTVVPGESTNAAIELRAASFSSLRQIGHVSVARSGAGSINTSSAAIDTVSAQTYFDQGQIQLPAVLNEISGVTTSYTNYNTIVTTANPGNAFGVPSIRGALPYETSVLIDGHPIVVGTPERTTSPT